MVRDTLNVCLMHPTYGSLCKTPLWQGLSACLHQSAPLYRL